MARRLPPPTYETETEEGLPHERQFTIACVVLNYREVGEGKSKKIAKRQAAQRMWQRLQDQPLEPSQIMQLLDEEGNEEVSISPELLRFDRSGANGAGCGCFECGAGTLYAHTRIRHKTAQGRRRARAPNLYYNLPIDTVSTGVGVLFCILATPDWLCRPLCWPKGCLHTNTHDQPEP